MVYLIGFMGVGKSTVGKKLAIHKKVSFFDTDVVIEKLTRKTIPKIFDKDGEKKFRLLETKVLKKLNKKSIISCGGGLPIFNQNMSFINNNGTSIYLEASPKTIFNRLKNKTNTRPLLVSKSDKELEKYISEKLRDRENVYKQAHYTINTDELSLTEILRQINALPLTF